MASLNTATWTASSDTGYDAYYKYIVGMASGHNKVLCCNRHCCRGNHCHQTKSLQQSTSEEQAITPHEIAGAVEAWSASSQYAPKPRCIQHPM